MTHTDQLSTAKMRRNTTKRAYKGSSEVSRFTSESKEENDIRVSTFSHQKMFSHKVLVAVVRVKVQSRGSQVNLLQRIPPGMRLRYGLHIIFITRQNLLDCNVHSQVCTYHIAKSSR